MSWLSEFHFYIVNNDYLKMDVNQFSFCMKFSRCSNTDISVWMETERFELLTPCLQGRCSPNWATPPLTKYYSLFAKQMGLSGLEPPTSRLSGVRSNQLSYKPISSGSLLLSRAVSSRVSSAGKVLTIVFGMGTGVPPCRIATRNSFVILLDNSTVKYSSTRFP